MGLTGATVETGGQRAISGGTPKRLHFSEGRWVLEVERLVRVFPTLYRPMPDYYHGVDRILKQLSSLPHLLESTSTLITNHDPLNAAREVFELQAGRWSRLDGDDELISQADARSVQGWADKLEGELAGEKSRNEVLQKRLERLESMMGSGDGWGGGGGEFGDDAGYGAQQQGGFGQGGGSGPGASGPGASGPGASGPGASGATDPDGRGQARGGSEGAEENGQGPVRMPSAPPGELSGAGSAEANAGAVEGANAEAPSDGGEGPKAVAGADSSNADGGDEKSHQDKAEAEAEEAVGEAMNLPEDKAWAKGLGELLGESVKMTPVEHPDAVSEDDYICRLIDDEGVVRGAIIADLRGTVEQGARLLMLPDSARAEQIEKGEPSEDAIEGMSEVLNILSRYFNEVEGNAHIRVTPLTKVDFEVDDWVQFPRNERVIEDPFGGHTRLIAR